MKSRARFSMEEEKYNEDEEGSSGHVSPIILGI
jgi:hypothetical protein